MTPYPNINVILDDFSQRIQTLLHDNLIGIYLFGSLVYGDFKENSSDIDLTIVLKTPLTENALEAIKTLHQQMNNDHKKWGERMECSYVPLCLLTNPLVPAAPRAYYNEGVFYEEAVYGNEWVINNYLLTTQSIALIGPPFSSLLKKPVTMGDVQAVCLNELRDEWQFKIEHSDWLNSSYHQSYLVLHLCRILYTIVCGQMASKLSAANWVKAHYPQWQELIEWATNWEFEQKLVFKKEVMAFSTFIRQLVHA